MADGAINRRESRKGPMKSYRVAEQFPSFLDSDDSDQATSSPDAEGQAEVSNDEQVQEAEEDEEGDPDDFVPNPDEEDEEEEEEPIDDAVDKVYAYSDDEVQVQEAAPRRKVIIEAGYPDQNNDHGSPGEARSKPRASKTASGIDTGFIMKADQSKLTFNTGSGMSTLLRAKGMERVHARGVEQFGKGGGLEARLKDLFGPTHQDLKPIIQTRDWWDHQETLPSRAEGSLRRSFHVHEGAREREIQKMGEWYSGVGKAGFANGQKTSVLSKEKGDTYMVNEGLSSMNLLMGQFNDPLLYKMKKTSYLSTATPFIAKEDRRGWIFNLGSKIQESQWATKEQGRTQYLAVAVQQVQTTGRKHRPLENPQAPAYSATEQFPASIQIWAFDATEEGDLDPQKPPRLELVICADWGAPKHFRWCPLNVSDDINSTDKEHTTHLGLLAGFWSDGIVRILDISYPRPDPTSFKTEYIHYSRTAFEAQIPHTIPTCLHWLSGTSLAVATASGTLAVWTLTRPETFRSSGVECHSLQPWFYKQVADTYILTLSSGYPSRPIFISFTTADGYAKLIDLRSPLLDTCTSARNRNLCLTQAWHEHTQAFIMVDDNYMLRNNTLRRYYTNIYTMRSESSIVCCATSPVQPGILIGCADGTVQVSNPIARLLNEKETPWSQTWFKHEWRPGLDMPPLKVGEMESAVEEPEVEEALDRMNVSAPSPDFNGEFASSNVPPIPTSANTNGETAPASSFPTSTAATPDPHFQRVPLSKSKVTPDVLAQPLARITEGYRVQPINLAFSKPYNTHTEGGKYVTIFEEPSAITTVAWNPNLKFGTWAAAGMGDGLLRVEDLNV